MNMFCDTPSLRTFSGTPVKVVINAHQIIISYDPRHILSSLTSLMKRSAAVCTSGVIYYYHTISSYLTQFEYSAMMICKCNRQIMKILNNKDCPRSQR